MAMVCVARSLLVGTPIADTFDRANSATTINPASDGGSWTVDTGVWGISSNKGYHVSNVGGLAAIGSGQMLIHRDVGIASHEMQVSITRSSTANSSALWVGYDPATRSGYQVLFDSSGSFGTVSRVAAIGGSSASLAFTAWTGGTTTLRVTYDGAGTVQIYQGATLIQTLGDSNTPVLTGTHVGFSTNTNTPSGTDLWNDFTAS